MTDTFSRRVLVTGAGTGIGRAIALRLAADGFFTVLHFRKSSGGAQSALEEILASGGKGSLISFDVCDEDAARIALEAEIEAHGAFYGVVCNAGITDDAAFPMMGSKSWRRVIDTNLNSFYNVLQPVVMPMIGARKGGRIVVISSVSGIAGNRGQTNYAASKAGLIGAVKSLAVELAKRKITVNAVAPGLIETGMSELEESVLKRALEMIPLQRQGRPEEVAHAVSYLMSDGAAYVTRQVLSVNGGMI